MKRTLLISLSSLLMLAAVSFSALTVRSAAQSGHKTGAGDKSAVLNVIVHAGNDDETARSLDLKDRLLLFDGGIQQQIEYFRADPTGARLILLVDTSQTLRTEAPQLQKVAQAIIKELYEGDEMMIIGFSEEAEVLQEFTGN